MDRQTTSPPVRPVVAPEERIRARRERHRRWISSLSERDWSRLRRLAAAAAAGEHPARLDDLDAAFIAVGVCPPGEEGRRNGERVGTLRVGEVQVPVLVWVK